MRSISLYWFRSRWLKKSIIGCLSCQTAVWIGVCRQSGSYAGCSSWEHERRQRGVLRAVNSQNENVLPPVLLRNENQIILSLKSDQNLGESDYGEIVFRLLYIHHQVLCSERYPGPLLTVRLN